jgi:hypothetical protein
MSTPDSIAMPGATPSSVPSSASVPGQPLSPATVTGDTARRLGTREMIDRLATEMRARSGGELPHSYYVEAVRRKLGGLPGEMPDEIPAANDRPASQTHAHAASVFHAWAIGER